MLIVPILRNFHPFEYLIKCRGIPVNQQLKGQVKATLAMPYPADPLIEPEYVGLTFGEVALIKQAQFAAAGSLQSLEYLHDRVYGKVPNNNVNLNTSVNYQDFLDGIAKVEEGEVVDITDRKPDEIS